MRRFLLMASFGGVLAMLAPMSAVAADVARGQVQQLQIDAAEREEIHRATRISGFLPELLYQGYRDYQPARAPLADVLVSDGYSFVETDEQGRYEIELHEEARWVSFINPGGTKPTERFYHRLSEQEAVDHGDGEAFEGLDFTVEPLPQSPDEPFRFVHHSDMHVLHDANPEWIYDQTVRHINRMADPPAFVLDTGDVSNDRVALMEGAHRAFRRYEMPVFAAKGNHDKDRDREAFDGETMERLFGPLYHGFTYGDYLFINLPWSSFAGDAVAWTAELLDRRGEDFHVIVGQHHWDGLRGHHDELFDLLKTYDAKGALWGHYHTSQMLNVEGVPNIAITAGDTFLRDLALPSFYLITAHPDGRLEADYRNRGYEHHQVLVHPADAAPLWRGASGPVQVHAYDTALEVEAVRVTALDAPEGEALAEVELVHGGGWAWAGALEAGVDWPAEVTLRVSVTDETGRAWPAQEHAVPVREADTLASVELDGDWGMYRGAPDRRGVRERSIAPPLRLAWVHVDRNFGLSAPIVAGGRVFAGVMNNHTPIDPFPTIIALDAETGEHLWSHEVADGRSVRSTLASDGRTVIAQLDDGTVIGVDAATGERRWEDDAMATSLQNAQIFLRSSPMIAEGKAIFGLRHFASVLDLESGAPLWQHVPDGGGRTWANPSWAKGGDQLFTARNIRALDTDTGSEQWEAGFRAGGVTPAFDGERLIVAGPGEGEPWDIHALDPATGESRWRTPLEGWNPQTKASPAVGDERVFFVFGDNVFALDKTDGEIAWRTPLEAFNIPGKSTAEASPVLAGDYLYVITVDGCLHVLEAGSGETLWRYDLGAPANSGLAISGNTLFITARSGALYAFVPAPAE